MKKDVFEKGRWRTLTNKVKESDFEIVSSKKRKGMSLHQSF
jgi:hypothetical protein